MLETRQDGGFVVRFSDLQLGAISITYVIGNQGNFVAGSLEPADLSQLEKLDLASRVRAQVHLPSGEAKVCTHAYYLRMNGEVEQLCKEDLVVAFPAQQKFKRGKFPACGSIKINIVAYCNWNFRRILNNLKIAWLLFQLKIKFRHVDITYEQRL